MTTETSSFGPAHDVKESTNKYEVIILTFAIMHVDLVVVFQAAQKTVSKQQTIDNAQKAEQQYKRLLERLSVAGLQAVGRRGEKPGQILVFVSCPEDNLNRLAHRERYIFLSFRASH